MYLTQDMEPTEPIAASKQIQMLDKLLLPKIEIKEEISAPDEILDNSKELKDLNYTKSKK